MGRGIIARHSSHRENVWLAHSGDRRGPMVADGEGMTQPSQGTAFVRARTRNQAGSDVNVMGSPHAGHENAAVDLLEWNLDEHRDHPYLITPNKTFSYGDVIERARTFGAGLLDRGLAHGDRVLIITKDCVEFVCTFWGAIRAGLVAVPISPAMMPAELRGIVDDSRATAVVFDPGSERLVAAAKLSEVLCIATEPSSIAGAIPWPDVTGAPERLRGVATCTSDIAFWLYTSGTTGTPKGVMHSHGNLQASRKGRAKQIGREHV